MSQFFHIHPHNPQIRLIKQAVDIIHKGGVIAYPTDSGYALGCHTGDKAAQDTIRKIRQVDDKHNFTLLCRDLSELSVYAKVGNSNFRLMKSLTPGPYTFILKATSEVPRRLMQAKKKTIGLRVPANSIAMELLAELNEPLLTSTLIKPGGTEAMMDPEDIHEYLGSRVALCIDGGFCGIEPTSVLDLTDDVPAIMRRGQGDVSQFEQV